jgi:hypothetical protein
MASLEAERGRLPESPRSLTARGVHIWFRQPDGVKIPNSSSVIAAGVDVRGEGGYILAPPSLHIRGRRYTWEWQARIDEVPLAPPPEWLLELMLHPRSGRHTGANGQHLPSGQVSFERLVEGIRNGTRDVELFRLAFFMHRRGFSRGYVEEVVLDAARRCKPAVPERIARLKVKSAWRY